MEKDSTSSSLHSPQFQHRKRSQEVVLDPNKPNGNQLLVNDKNKYRSMMIRAYSSFWMIGGYFFFTAMWFIYGHILSPRLVNTVISDKFIYQLDSTLIKYHTVVCYFLYISGFMWFILTLKKKMYKYQFSQYAWTHMILIVVFAQSSFTVASIFEGIFRTPLIELSPKKTWEGFIGASFTTIISAFWLANILGRSQWLTCPRKDLSTGWLQCDPGPLFKPEYYSLQEWVPDWFPWKEMCILSVQWHALYLGLFASIIATFGGFFSSGFKRAFKIKVLMSLSLEEQQMLFEKLGQIIGERKEKHCIACGLD